MHGVFVGLLAAHDGIDDRQQLASQRDDGNLELLALLAQTTIEITQCRLRATHGQCRHVQLRTHMGPAAEDATLAAMLAAVVGVRSQAHQGRQLLARELAQLRKTRQQRSTHHRTHARNRLLQLVLRLPVRVVADGRAQLVVVVTDVAVEPRQVLLEILANLRIRTVGEPVRLHGPHVDQLTTACHQRIEGLGLLVGKRPWLGSAFSRRNRRAIWRRSYRSWPAARWRSRNRVCLGLMMAIGILAFCKARTTGLPTHRWPRPRRV